MEAEEEPSLIKRGKQGHRQHAAPLYTLNPFQRTTDIHAGATLTLTFNDKTTETGKQIQVVKKHGEEWLINYELSIIDN